MNAVSSIEKPLSNKIMLKDKLPSDLQNKILHRDCIQGMSTMPDECVDLVISDPPYWKVVGHTWDYQWRTREDYLEWSEKWLQQAARVLRKGGTFYLFGYFRTLAYMMPMLDSLGLELKQQIMLDKGMRSVSGRATKNYKMFPNTTESLLLLVKDSKPFIKQLLKQHQKRVGISAKEINERLGVKSNGGGMWSIYTGENICEQTPTEELWGKLQEILDFSYPYEMISQTFNAEMGLTDVWTDIDFYEKNRFHPTQKPLKLINRLVRASSNRGDVVLDPFMGSGTTAVSCVELERMYTGFEIDKEYYEKSQNRLCEGNNNLFQYAKASAYA